MTKLFLPSIPRSPMYVGDVMTREWQDFFRNLFVRVGSEDGTDTEDVFDLLMSTVITTESSYEKRIAALEARIEALTAPKDYGSEIAALRDLIHATPSLPLQDTDTISEYLTAREHFKYNLPLIVWDDLRFPVGSVRGAGAFAPTPTIYRNGVVESFSSGPNNEAIQFIAQLPHGYKEGSNIEFHLHWTIPNSGLGAGAENVKWDFTHSWSNVGGSFPAQTTETVTVDVQGLSVHDHILTDVVTVTGTGKELSSVLICSLTRDVGVANDYAHQAYFATADFHVAKDTVGSRLVLEK